MHTISIIYYIISSADRPISHASTEGSSGLSSPPFDSRSPSNPYPAQSTEEEEEEQPHLQHQQQQQQQQQEGSFVVPDEDEILKLTMAVVKTVKELSDKVHKSKPNDYVEFVKVRRCGRPV